MAATAAAAAALASQAGRKLLVIFDGHHLAHRSYYNGGAFKPKSEADVPTAVTHLSLQSIRKVLQEHRPDALAVVFDGGTTFRHALSLLDPTSPNAGGAGPAAAQARREAAASGQLDSLAERLLHRLAAMPVPLGPDGLPPKGALEDARAVLLELLGPSDADRLGVAAAQPTYKTGRLKPGDDFAPDLANLQRLLGLLRVPVVRRPWLEADDLAALLATQARRRARGEGARAGCEGWGVR